MKRKLVLLVCMLFALTVSATLSARPVYQARRAQPEPLDRMQAVLDQINAAARDQGLDVELTKIEFITTREAGRSNRTILAWEVGHKGMPSHFVPGDPRRGGRTHITYTVDLSRATSLSSGLGPVEVEAVIDRAMETWDAVKHARVPLEKVEDPQMGVGVADFLLWLVGCAFNSPPEAVQEALDAGYERPAFVSPDLDGDGSFDVDIIHGGWLPACAFELAPGASQSIIGATLTWTFRDPETGEGTDIDEDGCSDVSWREIYYNDYFLWGIDVQYPAIDVESVALHESGHGLSLAHFGKMFIIRDNFIIAPRAIMNPIYYGLEQELYGPDVSALSSVWANWPKKNPQGGPDDAEPGELPEPAPVTDPATPADTTQP